MSKKKKNNTGMPSFTVDGKRQILKTAISALGEKQVESWLREKNIPSVRQFNEQIRKYGAKYFRELYELSKTA